MPEDADLTLYYHPFASFCQKVLIALYENAVPFRPHLVDLGDPDARAAFLAIWPIGRFPVLRDHTRDRLVPESSTIVEYLALHRPGPVALVPGNFDLAIRVRLVDRFYDAYVEQPMQKIVLNTLRPPGRGDPHGVEEARALLHTACGVIEAEMAARTWAVGEDFTMADCAAAPALFYANWVQPLAPDHPNVAAYLARLRSRPSFARVVDEARPYRHLFPAERRA